MCSFSERFVQLKSSKNLSFQALSAELGISLRALKYYASAKQEPTMSTLIALADYFQVSLDYLVGRSDNPKMR